MNPPNLREPGHSADVRIHLYLNGHVLPVAQLGPDFLVLRQPIDHPAADAEIALSIDGHDDRWRVCLESGIQSAQRRTSICRCADDTGSAVR